MIETKEQLEQFVITNWDLINRFIDEKQKQLPMPIYTSVDIRESHTRFAPVDNNLYPAGFNNICALDLNICAERLKNYINEVAPAAQHVGIIPESHTKNKFYLDHLATLYSCLNKNFTKVSIISPDENLFQEAKAENLVGSLGEVQLISHSGHSIRIDPVQVKDQYFQLNNGERLDVVVLNHDQSKPLPVNWSQMKQLVFPTPHLGWTARQKIKHFEYYQKITDEFCEHFKIKPELIRAKFVGVNGVDFETKDGIEKLADAVGALQATLPSEDSQIFVKASQGTYGMGISVVKSRDDILAMNRKTRNKMDVGKNNLKFQDILVQEGIETMIKVDAHPAEVTIYLIGGKSTGGFMRINPLKDAMSNLNARGMIYQKYCISEIHQGHDHQCKEAIYCLIARLSTLATAYEIKDTE